MTTAPAIRRGPLVDGTMKWHVTGDLDCPNGITISAEHPEYGETTIAKVTFAHPDVDDRSYCTRDEAQSHAAFIIRACNCHEQLVEALETAIGLLEYWGVSDGENAAEAIAEIRAALEAAL